MNNIMHDIWYFLDGKWQVLKRDHWLNSGKAVIITFHVLLIYIVTNM